MKRFISIMALVVLTVSMIAMTSCGKSELSGQIDGDKNMTINAVKADKGEFFLSGSLEVEEGEQIVIDTNLEAGEITLEFIASEGSGNIDELPDTDAEATYTAYLSGTDSQTVSFGAGSFMVKPTVTEKATGTVEITVQPAN
ncbi:MAG: hypothetical protein IKA94_07950 [Mogibacterium sp.]|nr:hypothetical protein [Mogibacterium sp.]